MNYKKTLNLPKTDFPMRGNLTVLEPKLLKQWRALDIYSKLAEARADNETFVLHDGPPYANGNIHMGHALNKILKDIVIKFKGLQGYNCPFICGWDCHGLPVEHMLLKELGLTKHDVEQIEFRRKARNYALKYVDKQRKDFARLGIFSDWEKPYLTVQHEYESSVLDVLGFLVRNGYVYRGLKPVNWCCTCETALAEAEVEYADKVSPSIYLLFKLKEDEGCNNKFIDGLDVGNKEIFFLVWTTTPWTLTSNVAVAVNGVIEYAVCEFDGKVVILAQELVSKLAEVFEAKIKVLKTYQGTDFDGMKLNHPFFDRASQVILADFVSNEDGSGCVHIAPGHGVDDFHAAKKNGLEIIMPLNDKGIFVGTESGVVEGKTIKQANDIIIALLEENGLLVKQVKLTHSYPHCWRCKQPIAFRATYQWFLNIEHNGLRAKLLDKLDSIDWVPRAGSERMKYMVMQRPDWCLSRQRLWGIPIPAVKCMDCGEVELNAEIIANVEKIVKEKGVDSWFADDIANFLPDGFKCSKCGSVNVMQEKDILDVWFESGASFDAVLKQRDELRFPADMYLEGSDQHRGWFQVSLILAICKEAQSPFKTLLTHGFVVDSEGKKMSKSQGNVIAPQDIIKTYGAEIIRLWVAYSDYTEDVRLSDEIIKQLVDMYRKIRNTIRFLLGNLHGFDGSAAIEYSRLLEVDKYMLHKGKEYFSVIGDFYNENKFYKACQHIFEYCNIQLSSFYLDILKDRLYTYPTTSVERNSALTVLHYILGELLKIIAPILSYTAEEAYSYFDDAGKRKESIFFDVFDKEYGTYDKEFIAKWELVLSLRDKVLKELENSRVKGLIGSSLDARVIITADKDYDFFKSYETVFPEIFIVSQVMVIKGDFGIMVERAKGVKCARCWNWREEITDDGGICGRCEAALKKEL